MSQENHATNSATPGNLPVKRKRGRPRKDERSIHGSATPGTDTVKRNRSRKIELAPVVTNAMVGQVVSGVLDGKFDAGYLLTVRVGDSNTILRGVVFEPGLSVPVSGANDVAPHIKMLKRNENPHPVVPLQTQMHGSNHQSQQQQTVKPSQRNVDPIPLNMSSTPVNQVPRSATHVLSSQLQTKPMASAEVRNDTNHVPHAASQTLPQGEVRDKASGNSFDGGRLGELNEVIQVPCKATDSLIESKKPSDIPTKDEADHPSKGVPCNNNQTSLIPPEQTAQSGLQIEPAAAAQKSQTSLIPPEQTAQSELQIEPAAATQMSQTSPLEHCEPAKPAEVVQENEMTSLSECPEDVGDTSKDTKLERYTDSSVETLLPSKTIDQVSQAGSEPVDSEHKPDQQNDDALKDQEVEPKPIIVAVAPEAMTSSPMEMLQASSPMEMLLEIPSTQKCDSLSNTEFKFEMLQEVPSTLKCDPLSDTEFKFPVEILKTDETSHSNEIKTIEAVKVTESDLQPEPGTHQEVEMLQGEAIPSKPNESENEQGMLSRDMPKSPTHESTLPTKEEREIPESLTHESTFPIKPDDYFPQDAPESRSLESALPSKVDAPESGTVESTLPTKEDDLVPKDTASLLQSLTNPEESNSYTDFL